MVFMSRSRAWAISVIVAVAVWLIYVTVGSGLDFFGGYRDLVLGADLSSPDFGVYAPPWLAPILAPFILLPDRIGFALFLAFSIFSILFTIRFLKGRPIPLLLSAQLSWILWWGQIDALAILGLGLAWVAYEKKSWVLMTLASLLALLKPQVSLIPVLLLWWWLGKERWKTLLLSAILFAASLLVWGLWPIWMVSKIIAFAGNRSYEPWNTSLGLAAIPLFIPALFIPLSSRSERLKAITATAMLVSPYMPYYSTLVLLCFPLSWWAYPFALLGYFPTLLGTSIAWKGITFLPVLVLLSVYRKPILDALRRISSSKKVTVPTPINILLIRLLGD
jgi:hypothetical protein